MSLLPEAAALLDRMAAHGRPPLSEMSVATARHTAREFVDLQGDPQWVADVRDVLVPGAAGRLPARVYRPRGDGPMPLLVYFHGGGWTWGDLELTDRPCREIANATGCVVVAVQYRLSPETAFPGPVEDAFAATATLAERAGELGADPARVCVAGDSAGGTLAAAVALMSRDRGGPAIAMQLLVYPPTTATPGDLDFPSYAAFGEGYTLTTADMERYWSNYCPTIEERAHPYAAPLRAERLSGLPPAVIILAECDVLRDEGAAYGARLQAAGVPTTVHCLEGTVHGFMWMGGVLPSAAQAAALMADAVAVRWPADGRLTPAERGSA